MKQFNNTILGTAQFGLHYGVNNTSGKPSEDEVYEILNLASNFGIGVLDTANSYGNAINVIGNYHKISDKKFNINSKFVIQKDVNFTYNSIINDIKILNVDCIDTLFFHKFNDFKNNHESIKMLNILKKNSFIKKIGVSVYNNDEFLIAINSDDINVIQFPFNLLDNWNSRGAMIIQAKGKGIELQCRSIFLQGLFQKLSFKIPHNLTPLSKYILKLKQIASDHSISIEQLALSYVSNHKLIDKYIIGVDNKSQLINNMNLLNFDISNEILKKINTIKVNETDLLNPINWN